MTIAATPSVKLTRPGLTLRARDCMADERDRSFLHAETQPARTHRTRTITHRLAVALTVAAMLATSVGPLILAVSALTSTRGR